MTHRQYKAEKCPVCRLFRSICICGDIVKFDLKTRITLLTHIKEVSKSTNTGKIAHLMLSNCVMPVLGLMDRPLERSDILFDEYENIVLFPYASNVLDKDFISKVTKPVNLIVPDGNYNQAVKMTKSHLLEGVRRVKLPSGQKSSYELRSMKDTEKISTIEAVIYAVEIIESPEAASEMRRVFLNMVKDFKTKIGML